MELAIRCMEDMKKAIARLEGAAAKSEDFAGFDHSGRSLR